MRPLVKITGDEVKDWYDEDEAPEVNWDTNKSLGLIVALGTKVAWYHEMISKNKLALGIRISEEACEDWDEFFEGYDISDDDKNWAEEITSDELKVLWASDLKDVTDLCKRILYYNWSELGEARGTAGKKGTEERKVLAKAFIRRCNFIWEKFGGNPLKDNPANSMIKIFNLTTNISDYYTEAYDPLSKLFGAYCAYCGLDVTIDMAVEHMLPKADFPLLGLSWDNLLLTCPSCNRGKSKSPSRKDFLGLERYYPSLPLNNPQADWPKSFTDQYITNETKKLWLWVNEDAYKGYVDFFAFRLNKVSYRNGKRSTAEDVHCQLLNKLINPRLTFDIDESSHPAIYIKFPSEERIRVELLVSAREGSGYANQAQRFIERCKLNREDVEKKRDQRIRKRTILWLKAIEASKSVLLSGEIPTAKELIKKLPLYIDKNFWAVQMDAYRNTGLLQRLFQYDKQLVKDVFYKSMPNTKISPELR